MAPAGASDRTSAPIDKVRAGAGLTNTYRAQPTDVRRLLAVGDAVCTTSPMGARGVSLGMESAAALADVVAAAQEDEWGILLDAGARPTWSAGTTITSPPTPPSRTGSTAETSTWRASSPGTSWPQRPLSGPELMVTLGPFLVMATPPAGIDPLREEVRAMLRAGWRPAPRTGATRDDLMGAIRGLRVAA